MIELFSAFTVVGALGLVYRSGSRWPLDVVGLWCAGAVLLYVGRAVLLALGLDQLSPEASFGGSRGPLVAANLLLVVWLVMVAAGIQLSYLSNRVVPGWVPVMTRHPDPRRLVRTAALLTLLGTLATVVLLAIHGGFSGLIRASKVDKVLAGIFVVRVVPEMAALVSVAAYLDVRRRGGTRWGVRERRRAVTAVAMAVVSGVWVFAWGSRDTLAIVALALVAGSFVFRGPDLRRSGRPRRRPWTLPLAVACTAVLVLAVGLRVVRDVATAGEVNSSIAGQELVRQVSVATNAVQYDALVLAVRDWPAVEDHRGGQDFVAGAAGVVPRALWPDKPEHVAPGAWFRQRYEPWTRNGWPMGATGEWYLAFGRVGVVVGGLLSGMLLGLAALALRNSGRHPLAFVLSLAMSLQVLLLGVHVQTPLRWVAWCLPFMLLGRHLEVERPAQRYPGAGSARRETEAAGLGGGRGDG